MSLPKFIYVFEEEDRDGTKYLVASTDPDALAEGRIGIYDVREELNVRHKLQFRRPRTKNWFDASVPKKPR